MNTIIAIVTAAIGCWAFFGGSRWLILRAMGQPPMGQVYGSWTCLLGAAVSAVAIVGLVVVWIWFTADSARDQIVPWIAMIASFAVGGAWCLWSGWGVRARHDESGVEFVDWRGRWHRASWTDLEARLSIWNTVMLAPARGPRLYIDPDAPGAGDLLIAAFEAGVAGSENFVRRRPTDGS